MDNSYLIPANTKSGSLIFNVFTKTDLILFSVGLGITFVILLFVPLNNLAITILAITPGLVSSFLVLPIPHYHNVLTVINSLIRFYTERRAFVWKGWCIHEYEEK